MNQPKLTKRLYSPGQIAVATFLGTPLGGGILLAFNYKSLGKIGTAIKSLIFGVLGTFLVFYVANYSTKNTPFLAIPLMYTAITLIIVNKLFGPTFKVHIKSGGRQHAHWLSVIIGIIAGIIVTIVFFTVFVMYPDWFRELK